MFLVYRHDITSYSKVKKLNKKRCLYRKTQHESKFPVFATYSIIKIGNGISISYLKERERVSLLDTEAAQRKKAILQILCNFSINSGVQRKSAKVWSLRYHNTECTVIFIQNIPCCTS